MRIKLKWRLTIWAKFIIVFEQIIILLFMQLYKKISYNRDKIQTVSYNSI